MFRVETQNIQELQPMRFENNKKKILKKSLNLYSFKCKSYKIELALHNPQYNRDY